MSFIRAIAAATLAVCLSGNMASGQEVDSPIEVRVVLDEAEAVIAILEKRTRGGELHEEDWRRLEESEGYVRLKRRQESFGAENFDERFREYLTSDEPMQRLEELSEALVKWRSIDVRVAVARAHAYLPAETRIRATIYPVIKRTTNSFVFELDTDPAIFMYVDPDRTPAQLENTLAHELHHVGSAACPDPRGLDSLAPPAQRVVSWLSAFAEGMAMLAAAGGPDIHPHVSSEPEVRAVWERDVAKFDSDLPRIERFFRAILEEELSQEEQRAQLFALINTEDVPQGAFYTVGWRMAALVERAQGREVIVKAVCDPRVLLTAYNEVATAHPRSETKPLPLWSADFLKAIGARP